MKDNDYEILTSSKFYLEIRVDGSDDRIDGYFMECSGFERSQDVVEFCQVTPQKWGKNASAVGRMMRTKMPGNSQSGNLNLRRGMTISKAVWDWFNAVEMGNWAKQRRNGDITLYDQSGTERARFRFLGAWPSKYKITDVKVDSSDFEVEEIELVIDEFQRIK
ncbi:phage tail protein [Calothrix sp. 336/3]|uniref:phage tail protein n=1 Tax=Calothrix sp. 336/3 TaxID=1337936 RepID=UPI0004E39865|nr:phage tail protein [Calothrix sp. 336/3]AKG20499.1 phage tail protein [Calothrix sp. 336/3]